MNKWTLEDLLRQLPVDQKALADRLIKDISSRFTLVWSDKRVAGSANGRTDPGFRAHYRHEGKNYTLIEYGAEGDVLLKFFEVTRHAPFDKGTDTLVRRFSGLASITKSQATGKISLTSILDEDRYSQFLEGLWWFIDVINNPESYSDTLANQVRQPTANMKSAILPTKEDFESAYRSLTRPGQSISIDSVLDQIEINSKKKGLTLINDWRMITEENIENWAGNK